jgi:hypothetical protein
LAEEIADVFKDKIYEEVDEMTGKDLVGLIYKPTISIFERNNI